MTKYICKCGRVVQKSTNADNTGNRDTAGCEGCPYLLPRGPMVWDERQKGYTRDVKGYECRMSPTLEYASAYHGRADDKCSLHIVSLDLDFLDEVQAWIYDNAADALSAGFSRGSMRGTDFCNRGRYSLSVLCAQNKRGIAAKAALLAEFFGPDKRRRDMTPEQEKAHILAAIEAGKARAQKKEDKALTYKDPATGWLYRVGPEPFQGSYWVYYLDPTSSTIWKRCPQSSLYAGNETAEGEEEYLRLNAKRSGWEPVEEKEWNKPKIAPSGAAAVTTDGSAAAKCGGPDAETRTTPADASGAQPPQPLARSAPRQTEHATDTAPAAPSVPVFDYSGLDDQTVADLHLAEREYAGGKKMAEMGLRRMADAVAIAHDALCGELSQLGTTQKHGNRGEDTFRRWCESMRISKSAAYRFLSVSGLFDRSTPTEQKVLEEYTSSVLYEASRPSAEPEAVEALKSKQVKTLKEYRALEAQIKAEREARERAEADLAAAQQEAALDRKEREDAHAAAMRYKAECDRRAQEQQRVEGLLSTREEQLRQAQQEAQDADRTIQRKQEAIEELDEIARDRLEQIEALEQGRTIEAQVSDPEEVRRQAEALARELAAAETEKLQSENRTLRSRAPAVQRARTVLVAVIAQIMLECDKLEADDEEGGYALIELAGELLSWSVDIKDRVMEAAGYEEDGYDTDEN